MSIKKILYFLSFLAMIFFVIVFIIAKQLAGGEYKGPISEHFDGKEFFNSYTPEKERIKRTYKFRRGIRLLKFFKDKESAKWPDWPDWPDWVDAEYGPPPLETVTGKNIRYTVINHATVLIQVNGLNILTDPIWSKRPSPFSWLGPSRVRNPGIRFEDLPQINLVLISHSHYDHMDLPTLKRLDEKFSPKFLVGLGNEKFLKSNGIKNVVDMDWWQKVEMNESAIYFVPASHGANRSIGDWAQTLWGGFLISSLEKKIFFSGDTGYSPHFLEIYKKFGPMDLSFLPIGAYEPRWFMKYKHLNPMDAVKAHQVLKSRQSVGIHFGTFRLTAEAIDDPIIHLKEALLERSLKSSDFVVPKFGQGVLLEW